MAHHSVWSQTDLQQVLDLLRDNFSTSHGQHTEYDDGSLTLRLGYSVVGTSQINIDSIIRTVPATYNTPAIAC